MKQRPCDLCHNSPAVFVPDLGYRCLACLDAYLDKQPDALAPAAGILFALLLTAALGVLIALAYYLIR